MPARKFIATEEQKAFVSAMAGFRLTHEQLAQVVHSPHTNRHISVTTLVKAFKQELAAAKTKMQTTILTKFVQALEAGSPWAIQWGLKHYCGYRDDATVAIGIDTGATGARQSGIQVSFVTPDPARLKEEEREPMRVIEHKPDAPTFDDQRLNLADPGRPDWPPPPAVDNRATHDNVTVLKPAAGQLNVNNADRVNNVNAPRGLGWMKS